MADFVNITMGKGAHRTGGQNMRVMSREEAWRGFAPLREASLIRNFGRAGFTQRRKDRKVIEGGLECLAMGKGAIVLAGRTCE